MYSHHFSIADGFNIKLRTLVGKLYDNFEKRNSLTLKIQTLLQEETQYGEMLENINATTKQLFTTQAKSERDTLRAKIKTIKQTIITTHNDLGSLTDDFQKINAMIDDCLADKIAHTQNLITVINSNNVAFDKDITIVLENSKPNATIPATSFTDTELKESLNKLYALALKPMTPLEAIATKESLLSLSGRRFHSEPVTQIHTLKLPSVPHDMQGRFAIPNLRNPSTQPQGALAGILPNLHSTSNSTFPPDNGID